MPDRDLQALVRRRLWELARSPEETTRTARWALAAETVQRLAQDRGPRDAAPDPEPSTTRPSD